MKSLHSTGAVGGITLFGVAALLVLIGCKETTLGPNDLTNPAIQPHVIFTLPGNNSIGPFELFNDEDNYGRPHFVVRYNKLMTLSSFDPKLITVEGFDKPARVDLYREYYPWEGKARKTSGTLNAQYDDILSFTIRDSLSYSFIPYRIGNTYAITIHPGLEDINGNKTSEEYRFTYKPEPFFRVIDIYPENTPEGVSISTPISVSFNSHLDNSIISSLQISPSLEGQWRIAGFDSSVAYFQTFDFLPFNSSFTITVHSNARDVYGNQIDHEEASSFSVAPFKVFNTSPPNGKINVDLDVSVWVNFTGSLDTATVRQSFDISPSTQGFFNYYNSQFSFQPINGLIPNALYTVTFTSNLRAYNGTPLSSPYTFSFSTATFRISNTYPSDGDFNVARTQAIYVACNTRLDTGSVRSAFTIAPPVTGRFDLYDGNSSFDFAPTSNLAPNTIYTVAISTGMRTKSGSNLSQPYTFRFKTGQ